jgi:hypothetical protein
MIIAPSARASPVIAMIVPGQLRRRTPYNAMIHPANIVNSRASLMASPPYRLANFVHDQVHEIQYSGAPPSTSPGLERIGSLYRVLRFARSAKTNNGSAATCAAIENTTTAGIERL